MDQRDILRSINWKEVEQQLERHFSNQYRKVWVQFTRHGSICVTAFLNTSRIVREEFNSEGKRTLLVSDEYDIFCFSKLEDWSVENLIKLIEEVEVTELEKLPE